MDQSAAAGTDIVFGFIKIIVEDIDRAADFYAKVLGLKVDQTIDTERFVEKTLCPPGGEAGPYFVLFQFKQGRDVTIGNGWGPAGFFVKDVDAIYQRALDHGATERRAPHDIAEVRAAFFRDLDGYDIELISRAV